MSVTTQAPTEAPERHKKIRDKINELIDKDFKITGKFLNFSNIKIDVVFGNHEELWELEVIYHYYPGTPGCTSGPPKKCYPPEPPEFDIIGVYLLDSHGYYYEDVSDLLTFSEAFSDAVIEALKNLDESDL